MDKVLDFDETLEENPLGSKFQCRFTYTGDNQDCERRYAVTSSFTESFNTQVGLDITVTNSVSLTADVLLAKATKAFEVSIGFSFSFGYTASTTTSTTNTFTIGASPPAGSNALIFFTESHIPTQLKWRATIVASGDVRVAINGVQKTFDISQLLLFSQRNLFAFGTIDYGKEHFIIGHVQITDVNGNLLMSNEEMQKITTTAEAAEF